MVFFADVQYKKQASFFIFSLFALAGICVAPCVFAQGAPTVTVSPSPSEMNSPSCIRVLADVNEDLEVRKKLIRMAKSEILISYYYAIARDEKSLYFLALLKEAVARGVKVKIILDDLETKVSADAREFLKDSGIELRFYNELNLKHLPRFDRRMHDKFAITDRQFLMVGGRNISDRYFNSDIEAKHTFYDIDELFYGKVAEDAGVYFDQRWDSSWVNVKTRVIPERKDYEDFKNKVAAAYAEMNTSGELSTIVTSAEMKIQACEVSKFYANDPQTKRRDRSLENIYIDEIKSAQVSIDLQNPYGIFTSRFKRAIKDALKRGVQVRVITNSLESNDLLLAQSAYLNLRPRLMRWGTRVFEFLHRQTLHSKIAIFDQKKIIVGSFNLDPRSARLNSLNIVVTDDPSAVNPIRAYFAATLDLASEIGSDGIPEGADERHPGTTFGRRLVNSIYRYTIAPLLRSKL